MLFLITLVDPSNGVASSTNAWESCSKGLADVTIQIHCKLCRSIFNAVQGSTTPSEASIASEQ